MIVRTSRSCGFRSELSCSALLTLTSPIWQLLLPAIGSPMPCVSSCRWAQNLSLVANILLLCIKMFAFIVSSASQNAQMLCSHAFDCQIVLLVDIESIWLITSHSLLQDLLQCLRRRPTQVSTLLVRWCCTFATGEPAGLVTDL